MIPEFPHFAYLDATHQANLSAIAGTNHPFSDYNFISLWSWDHQNKLKVSTLNDNLVIRFQDYLDPSVHFYSFFGTNMVEKTATVLLCHSKLEGVHELRLVPQFVIEHITDSSRFVVTEDRDNFDYIVGIDTMVELKNGENEKKRWSLNQFLKNHADKLLVRELDIKDADTTKQMLSLATKWSVQTSTEESYENGEGQAIKKILENHHQISTEKLHLVGLYLDDELKAFSMTEVLENGFAIGHYKKTDRTYRGLGVALDHYTAKSLRDKGVSYLNHEQDLGIEGLRKAKLASHPLYFLKKYIIALR
jgi:uncharacterized protein